MPQRTKAEQAAALGIGAAAGVITGLTKNANAVNVRGAGLAGSAAKFFHGATRALKSHKGAVGALGAGAAAVVGPSVASAAVAAAPVVVAAAPFVLGAAAVGAAVYGIKKLIE